MDKNERVAKIEIVNPEDLELIRYADPDQALVVTFKNSIDMKDIDFVPISLRDRYYPISVLGNNCKISNLTIDQPLLDNVGLFGEVSEKNLLMVKDLYFIKPHVVGMYNVGIIAGSCSGEFYNCCVYYGRVLGLANVGGLVGKSSIALKLIEAETNELKVIGSQNVGSLAGNVNEAIAKNCEASIAYKLENEELKKLDQQLWFGTGYTELIGSVSDKVDRVKKRNTLSLRMKKILKRPIKSQEGKIRIYPEGTLEKDI